MPSLMLRGLDAALVARIRAYATAQGLGYAAGAIRLLTIALDHLDARQRGAASRWEGTTPEQRREMTAITRRARQASR